MPLYAEYVELISSRFDDAYERRARELVHVAATFLVERLLADGRVGACVDTSVFLGQMLERLGVWSFALRGDVAIVFPEASRIPRYTMRTATDVPGHGYVPGHVWLRAPPFQIVDVTIRLQEYENGEGAHIPESVVEEAPDIVGSGFLVRRRGLAITYEPRGVTVLGERLEDSRHPCFSGRRPADLWADFQRTRLAPG